MTFDQPLWLLLLLAWPLVPLLDRMARPAAQAALPLPHLGERGLRTLPATLPWLSTHGLAYLLLVLALASPQAPRRAGWQQLPPLYAVVADAPGLARWPDLVRALPDRPLGLILATAAGVRLQMPLTTLPAALAGPWPGPPAPAATVGRALLLASAKAPEGAWLTVLGGQTDLSWMPALALASRRHQTLAHLAGTTGGPDLPLAYATPLREPDAVAGLRFRLDEVSHDQPVAGPPLGLARYCLAGALSLLVLGWWWQQRRWQVVGP